MLFFFDIFLAYVFEGEHQRGWSAKSTRYPQSHQVSADDTLADTSGMGFSSLTDGENESDPFAKEDKRMKKVKEPKKNFISQLEEMFPEMDALRRLRPRTHES